MNKLTGVRVQYLIIYVSQSVLYPSLKKISSLMRVSKISLPNFFNDRVGRGGRCYNDLVV